LKRKREKERKRERPRMTVLHKKEKNKRKGERGESEGEKKLKVLSSESGQNSKLNIEYWYFILNSVSPLRGVEIYTFLKNRGCENNAGKRQTEY
jgi:hypothetical protein